MSIGLLAGAAMGRGVIDFNHHDNICGLDQVRRELGLLGAGGLSGPPVPGHQPAVIECGAGTRPIPLLGWAE
jgi:hypothetical protein